MVVFDEIIDAITAVKQDMVLDGAPKLALHTIEYPVKIVVML